MDDRIAPGCGAGDELGIANVAEDLFGVDRSSVPLEADDLVATGQQGFAPCAGRAGFVRP